MKAAVYCGTRNLYSDMVTAAKSLAVNSSVDVIYFLIEDSVFPYELPDYIRCIDVSEQRYFRKNGPNVYRLWTWMVLMRAALTKVFPDLDRILSLDVDTIVNQNIDELWDLPIGDYYLAGVPEPTKTKANATYVNMGAVMFNLKMLRETQMDEKIIKSLNKDRFRFAEQDCMNLLLGNRIMKLSSIYNANDWTEKVENPKIYHFACDKKWNQRPIVKYYESIPWVDIRRIP